MEIGCVSRLCTISASYMMWIELIKRIFHFYASCIVLFFFHNIFKHLVSALDSSSCPTVNHNHLMIANETCSKKSTHSEGGYSQSLSNISDVKGQKYGVSYAQKDCAVQTGNDMNFIISPSPEVTVKGNRTTLQEEGHHKNSSEEYFVTDDCQTEINKKTCSDDDVIMIDNSSGDDSDVELIEPSNHPQGNLALFHYFNFLHTHIHTHMPGHTHTHIYIYIYIYIYILYIYIIYIYIYQRTQKLYGHHLGCNFSILQCERLLLIPTRLRKFSNFLCHLASKSVNIIKY